MPGEGRNRIQVRQLQWPFRFTVRDRDACDHLIDAELGRTELLPDPAQDAATLGIDLADRIEQRTADEGGAEDGLAVPIRRITAARTHDAAGLGAASGSLFVAARADFEDPRRRKELVEVGDKGPPVDIFYKVWPLGRRRLVTFP